MRAAGNTPWPWLVWLGSGLAAVCLLVLLLARMHLGAPQVTPPAPPPPPGPLTGVTVILDPGHGGADSGAVRNGVCEAALTYRTADELADSITQEGGRVLFTVRSRMLDPSLTRTEPPPERPHDAVLAVNGSPLRERETPRPLWLRAAITRGIGRIAPADVFFLSLHYDDFHRASVHGALVCVDRRAGAVPPLARLMAARLCADGFARSDVYHGLRGVAAERLGVLDPHYNPVPERVLLELATISNAADALCAADPDWRRGLVAQITEALVAVHQGPPLSSRGIPAVQ